MAELDEKLEENRVNSRIKELSDKVELTSKERDEQAKLVQEKEQRVLDAEKERDFYAGFSDEVAKNPQAREHKDAILEKVKAGYSVEDATISVLVKEGKYNPQAVVRENPAGGSASTTIQNPTVKSSNDMSREEKRQALMDAERRGDLGFQ